MCLEGWSWNSVIGIINIRNMVFMTALPCFAQRFLWGLTNIRDSLRPVRRRRTGLFVGDSCFFRIKIELQSIIGRAFGSGFSIEARELNGAGRTLRNIIPAPVFLCAPASNSYRETFCAPGT